MSIDESAFRVPAEEVQTAGLRPQGFYQFKIEKAEPQMVKVFDSDGNDTGAEEPAISVQLRPVGYAEYDEDGVLVGPAQFTENDRPPRQIFRDLKIKSRDERTRTGDIQRFSTMYEVVTGRAMQGRLNEAGTYDVDYIEDAKSLLNGEVWGSVTWFRLPNGPDKGKVLEVLDKKFRKHPPERFRVRDIQEKEE